MSRTVVFALSMLTISSPVLADGHGHGHHHGHHDDYVVEHIYYPQPVVGYVAPPPPVIMPAPAPVYRHAPDRRTTAGLVGGALGSAAGYEISQGNPLGAGLGAAAGAWIGNGMR